jgi:hypothetical protein
LIIMKKSSPQNIAISPSQQAVLTAAAQHKQGLATRFPETLKGGARAKVLEALTNAGWLAPTGEGVPQITEAGYSAIGVKPPKPRKPKTVANERGADTATQGPAKASRQRQNSKQAQVIEMLKRSQGASIEQVMQATEWQQHTVRGFFAGALKKKLGLLITSDKADGEKRVYRIEPSAASIANHGTGAQ